MGIVPKKDKNVFAILQGKLSSGATVRGAIIQGGGELVGGNFPRGKRPKTLNKVAETDPGRNH